MKNEELEPLITKLFRPNAQTANKKKECDNEFLKETNDAPESTWRDDREKNKALWAV